MSVMNDLDLKLNELENQIDQAKETVQSLLKLLSSNSDEDPSDMKQFFNLVGITFGALLC